MSQESFDNFRRAVLLDETLQLQLRGAADFSTFTPLAMQLGLKMGFEFTAEDVEAARHASMRAWFERHL